MSAPSTSTPSDPPSTACGSASPPSKQPVTTAAQAIALAATAEQVVELTSPHPGDLVDQDDDSHPSQPAPNSPVKQTPIKQEQPPPAPTTLPAEPIQRPLSSEDDKLPTLSTGQPCLQVLTPRPQILQGQPPSLGGQSPQHQPYAGQSHSQFPQEYYPPPGQPSQDQHLPGQPPPGQPYPNQPLHYVGPDGRRLYYDPLHQARLAPSKQPLGPLQPLPRGRPPRPQLSPKTQGMVWGTQPTMPPQEQVRKPPVGPAYTRGGHLLGGYNPSRYMGVSNANPNFDEDGKFFYLTGPRNLDSWMQEIACIAKAFNCFNEMTKRFVGFPPPNTVQLFICETRFATAWRVLEGTIAGQVWAYMRVLGYSSIAEKTDNPLMSPTPADCYEFAQRAARRMFIAGTVEQPQEERERMVEEILTAQATEYPSERSYKKGIKWLRLACDGLIKQGDYSLAVALYDPVPEWAPKPANYETPAAGVGADGAGSVFISERRGDEQLGQEQTAPTSVAASASPVEQAVGTPPISAHATPAPDVHSPTPPQPGAKKRKRSLKDEGSQPAQTLKNEPGSTAGANNE